MPSFSPPAKAKAANGLDAELAADQSLDAEMLGLAIAGRKVRL